MIVQFQNLISYLGQNNRKRRGDNGTTGRTNHPRGVFPGSRKIEFLRPWSDPALLLAGAGLLWWVLLRLLRTTYVQAEHEWPREGAAPRPLSITPLDYFKALIAWADGYRRTYAIEPGLYFTGEAYDRSAPLLVTANYQLTVFLLVRRCRRFNARLLVIDSDAINVWCAAGKGRFGNDRIVEQLERYDRELLAEAGRRIRLILPKFGFPGVDYRTLFHHPYRLRPVIGPLYAKDLPEYLAAPSHKDRRVDRVHFGLQSRLFTWLPGFLQTVGYYFPALLLLLGLEAWLGHRVALGLLGLPFLIAALYPLLFPHLPGTLFSVKGLGLGGAVGLGLAAGWNAGLWSGGTALAGVFLSLAASLFYALSYTGNSAVSNYTSVRRETARFLPWSAVFIVVAVAVFLYSEWRI